MTPIHAKSAALAGIFTTNSLAMITSEHISSAFQFGTMIGIVVLAYMQKKTARVTEKIHLLSNSAMEAQMRIVWLQAKRIADMTKKKVDRDIAVEAQKAYQEHVMKQKAVDATPPP